LTGYVEFRKTLDGMYATGRYAKHKNSVISYADINVYFKNVQCSSRNTTNVTYKVKKTRALWVISAFINLNIDFERSKTRKSNKQTLQI